MKFFIPHVNDVDKENGIYLAIKKFLESQLGFKITERSIYKLHYIHKGVEHRVEVGKPDPRTGEVVMAIMETLESTGIYYVCSPNRGVARDMPILVGSSEVLEIEDFDK